VHQAPPERTGARREQHPWPALGWTTLYVLAAGALQRSIPYPWDNDTAYHAAVGRLMREHGLLHAFPWTPFSLLSDRYADKELLFHLLFVPVAGLDWVVASQIIGTLAGAALLSSLYFVLRREGVRYAGLWALAPLLSSVIFIYRFVLVRPHLLSIALALVFLWAAVRGRYIVLAALSALYPWVYVAFWQLPCLLLIAAETARFLSEGRASWKPAAIAAAGITAGVAVHPDTANLLAVNWIHMADVLFRNSWMGQQGFDLGAELEPLPVAAWAGGLGASVLMTVFAAWGAWKARRTDIVLMAFSLASLGFCVLTARSGRFVEYFVPFSVAAAALASRLIAWRFFSPAVIGASAVLTLGMGAGFFAGLTQRPNEMPADVASYLRQQIPEGAQIFTPDWDHTGWLLLTLPDRRFMVALDPTLFYRKDPERYRLWYRICHEAQPDAADAIRRYFGARYVLGLHIAQNNELFYQLSRDPGVKKMLYSDSWLLFDLGQTARPEEPHGQLPSSAGTPIQR